LITILDDHEDAHQLDPLVTRHRLRDLGVVPRERAGSENEIRSKANEPKADRNAGNLLGRKFKHVLKSAAEAKFIGPPLRSALGALDICLTVGRLRAKLSEIAPDAVLSFLTQTNVITILATRGLPIRTIVSERNDPKLQRHRPRVELLRRFVYRWSDVVTANTQGALASLEQYVPKGKLAFLPNPIAIPSAGESAQFLAPTYACVARLVAQKGLDILLRASAQALQSLPEWRLAIIGDGPLRNDLQTLARDLEIADRVDWLGEVSNPFPYLRAAQFFVSTSRFEGSPNALLEAMSCGLAAIVTDASPGPLELVGGGDAGLIVPVNDVQATAAAITRLATDEQLRASLGQAAARRAKPHQLDSALAVWCELIKGAQTKERRAKPRMLSS
jgi:glycosyltransferase involved in cell wall biosynthesis